MTCIAQIQPFVQEYAETIADVLEIDVTIVDEEFVRIGGTGLYKQDIGQHLPEGSFFRHILETGKTAAIHGLRDEAACQGCITADKCRELATIGYPIIKDGKPVGVIGIIAFTAEQQQRLIDTSEKLITFLRHMSSLLAGKLILLEANLRLQHQVQEALVAVQQPYFFGKMFGCNKQFISLLQKAEQVAAAASTVLIRGESGTGKELLARAIHDASNRKGKPFVVINCPSIPDNLLESELFGYESGTFTGASRHGKIGKFELATGGTIFLDEIGDLPLALQPKLLRVIQERSVDRLGAANPVPVDIRVIAATNRNLESMVQKGTFRDDLYYRLNVIPLIIPPLRDRREDIGLYLEHFLDQYGKRLNKGRLRLEPNLANWLVHYGWPGNVRQLENIAEYMAAMAKDEMITRNEVPENLINHTNFGFVPELGLQEQLEQYEKAILTRQIAAGATVEQKKQAAERLGISIATLYRKLEKYSLM